MPTCPACLGEFSPKENHKAHHCDCGSLLRLTTDGWIEHVAVHSVESTEEERNDVPPGWEVDGWVEVDGVMKPIFRVAKRPFFEQKDPAVPLYRNPPREKIGKSGSDWNGSSATRRYLEREK